MLLSAEHLSINFGSRQLLEDVNFYLNEGDKIGVIGINGTGKSTLGCAITNGVGAATGANFLGLIDLLVGTAATLLAAITSRLLGKIRFGGVPWLSVLPPILFNAVAIGAEWCYAATGSINVAFWAFAGQIALGQLPPCLLGVWLIHLLERRGLQNIIEGK